MVLVNGKCKPLHDLGSSLTVLSPQALKLEHVPLLLDLLQERATRDHKGPKARGSVVFQFPQLFKARIPQHHKKTRMSPGFMVRTGSSIEACQVTNASGTSR